jgi:hypothetical protein
MDTVTLIIVLVVAALLFLKFKEIDTVPATSDDWYVIFDIDAEHKVLSLWFYPIIAISGLWHGAKVVTSNPSETKRLQQARKEEKINGGLFGLSFSYGRWYRDGISIDNRGKPDINSSDTFSKYIARFLVGNFNIRYATPIPIKYQLQIELAHKLAAQERINPPDAAR